MSTEPLVNQFRELSADEQIRLVQELWNEIADEVSRMPLSDPQRGLLDERLADEEQDPDDVEPWAKARLELLVRGRAKADIRRAAKWYERQQKGLGKRFVAEVDAALERIEANPEQYQIVHRDIRHAITRHFPYGVFYRIRGRTIIVFAVVHLLRDDVHWKT